MTQQYSQSVEVEVNQNQKKFQYLGISSVLISLGFILLSSFLSLYFLFGFGSFLVLGILFLHTYNNYAREYIYDYNEERLVIIKKDLLNRQSRILCLLLSDIISIGVVDGLIDDNDIVACNGNLLPSSKQIIFKENNTSKRLIFEPDDYLVALFNEHKI